MDEDIVSKQKELENKYALEAIEKNRNMRVVKANAIMQKGKFELSDVELRLVNFAISRIKPTDTSLDNFYGFTIQEFCECYGIDPKNGGNYRYIKQKLKDVADKSFYMEDEENPDKSILIRWFSKVEITKGSGYIRVKFDPDLAQYLICLPERGNYYSFIIENTRRFKSKESTKLYETLKSYAFAMGPQAKTQRDFTRILNISDINYSVDKHDPSKIKPSPISYKTYRTKILEPALNEINKYSDMSVTFIPFKVGRTYKKIEFHIHMLDSVELYRRMNSLYAEEKKNEIGISNKKQIEGQADIFSVYKETVEPYVDESHG